MKKVLLALLVLLGLQIQAQTTVNPDTVCAGALGEQYFVTNTPGSTYQWNAGGASAALVGNPSGGTWTGTGVLGNNFDPNIGQGNYILTYSVGGCITTINVTVNNGPITGPIQHF